MERDAIDFGSLKVSVLFRRLFIPTLCGMLSISAVTVADGIFVGQGVGSDGIAAVNIYVPLLMVFQGMGLMIGIGCSVVASIHLSQSKIRAARLNVTQAMVFVTAVTLLLSSAILLFPDRTAVLLGASEHLLPLVKDYLLWFTPALVFHFPDVDGRRTFRYPFGRGAEAGDVVQCYLGVAQRVAGLVVYFPAGVGRHGGCVRYRDQCIRRRRYRFVVPAVPGPFVVPLSA